MVSQKNSQPRVCGADLRPRVCGVDFRTADKLAPASCDASYAASMCGKPHVAHECACTCSAARVDPAAAPHCTAEDDAKVIAITPGGRRQFLRILKVYMARYHAAGVVHEWHDLGERQAGGRRRVHAGAQRVGVVDHPRAVSVAGQARAGDQGLAARHQAVLGHAAPRDDVRRAGSLRRRHRLGRLAGAARRVPRRDAEIARRAPGAVRQHDQQPAVGVGAAGSQERHDPKPAAAAGVATLPSLRHELALASRRPRGARAPAWR